MARTQSGKRSAAGKASVPASLRSPGTLTNPFAGEVKKSQKQLEKATDKLSNRPDLKKTLAKGVTAKRFNELKQSSNAHDRKVLDDYAKRAAQQWASTAKRTGEASGRTQAVSGYKDAGYHSILGLASINTNRIRDDLLHRLGPLPAFATRSGHAGVGAATGAGLVGYETVKHPIKTAMGLGEIGAGGIAAIPELVTHPGAVPKLGEAFAKDLKDRYGPLFKGDAKAFKDRLEKQGTAAELLDASSVITGGGAAAGKVAGALARSGKLGKAAEEFATAARPALQVGGNIKKDQQLADNLVKVAGQRRVDKARVKATAKRAEGGDALAKAAEASGAVLPRWEIPVRTKLPARTAAKAEGVARLEHKQAMHDALAPLRADIKSLSKPETAALKYAVQYGIRTPEQATAHLPTLAKQIADARAATKSYKPGAIKADELPQVLRMIADPAGYFTPKLAAVADRATVLGERMGALDPRFSKEAAVARAGAAQAALLDVKAPGSDLADILSKALGAKVPELHHNGDPAVLAKALEDARTQAGLAKAGYFPSEKYPLTKFNLFTRGNPMRMPNGPRRYSGILRDLGMEHADPKLLEQALAGNLKASHQLEAVSRTIAQQTLPWSGKGSTPAQLLERSFELGIDPKTWVAVSPRAIDKALKAHGEHAAHLDLRSASMRQALLDSVVDGTKAAPPELKNMPGYVAIPRAVFDELTPAPSGGLSRGYGLAKGTLSRAMLGLNPTWPAFQIAGNTLQAALAGTRPGRAKVFKAALGQLGPEEQRRVNAALGIYSHEMYNQERLGSLAPDWVKGWQQFRETTPAGRALGKLEPTQYTFKLDEKQNNAFRRSVAGAKLDRMAKEAQAGTRLMDKAATREAILRDPAKLDQLAEHVNKFLGDYTSFTKRERKGRNFAMFYGWMRFSTQLLFRTMPMDRPVVGAVIGQLGKLHANEVKEIFGADAPPWMYSYAVLGGNKDQPIGINAARLIPFMNALADPGTPDNPFAAGIGAMGPLVEGVVNAATGKDIFTGRNYEQGGNQLTEGQRNKIFLATVGASFPPYRIGARLASPKKYEAADPLWLRALRQAAPLPGPIPYSANGSSSARGSGNPALDELNKLTRSKGSGNPALDELNKLGF